MMSELPLEVSDEVKKELIKKIKALINDKRDDKKGLYYLSSLGEDLGDNSDLIEPYFGLKLRGLIEKETDEKLVALGKNQNVFAIVLRDDYEVKSNKLPQYKRSFWTAFFSSSDQSEPRFLNIETLYHKNKKENVRGSDQIVKEIHPRFFTDHDASDPVADTHSKIDAWLKETGLSSEDFILQNSTKRDANNLLESVIKALDDGQLRNTNLSLDVIKRLMES